MQPVGFKYGVPATREKQSMTTLSLEVFGKCDSSSVMQSLKGPQLYRKESTNQIPRPTVSRPSSIRFRTMTRRWTIPHLRSVFEKEPCFWFARNLRPIDSQASMSGCFPTS
jgi:hypothetical protein